MPIDCEAVRKAFETIKQAIESEEFRQWIDQNYDELNDSYLEYEHYCEMFDEQPLPFEIWALKVYVRRVKHEAVQIG